MARRGLEQIQYPPRKPIRFRPIGGMNTLDPASALDVSQSPDMLNCSVLGGLLCKRPGYVQYPTGGSAMNGVIVGLYSTKLANGTVVLVAVTPTDVYVYDDGIPAWTVQTGGPLTGTAEMLFAFETSQDSIVLSQGADVVQKLNLGAATYAALNANCPAARILCRFNTRLNLGYTKEGGVNKPFRHRRSVSGDHTDWVGLGSGFRDASEWSYHMRGMRKLQNSMLIYYEKVIEECIPQPNSSAPYRYEGRVIDIGLLGQYTLKGRNEVHFFLGNDSAYLYSGGQLQDFATLVSETMFTQLRVDRIHRCFAELSPTREYCLFLVTGNDSTPGTVWVFNWHRGVMYPWSVSGPTCACVHSLDSSAGPAWNSVNTAWNAQNWVWDSSFLTSAQSIMLTGHTNGKVYRWGTAYRSDNLTSIPCKWTSKDFTSENVFGTPMKKLVLQGISVEYVGVGVTFSLTFDFSIDGGTTWGQQTVVSGVAAGGGFLTLNVDRRVTGDRIRFRMRQDSATEGFTISAFTPEFELEEATETP